MSKENSLPRKHRPLSILYIVISLIFAVIGIFYDYEYELGFIARIFIFIFGFIGAYIGITIGDFYRRFARPDIIWTRARLVDIIHTKLFWAIVPQIFGCAVGWFFVTAIIVNIFK